MRDLYQYLFSNNDCSFTLMQDKLHASLKKLPDDNHQAITLHFIDKLSRKEIASKLGWSVSKVNTKITRGITLLKWELNPAAFTRAKELLQEMLKEKGII